MEEKGNGQAKIIDTTSIVNRRWTLAPLVHCVDVVRTWAGPSTECKYQNGVYVFLFMLMLINPALAAERGAVCIRMIFGARLDSAARAWL